MPLTLHPKTAEKHLIFVKNIPTYMATSTIPALFNEYGAFNVKNVYPESSMTTAVISFRTKDEAARAQEETDGMRLNNVILRVEMYDKHRSVRFLREKGQAKRPLGEVEGHDEADSQERITYETDSGDISPPELVAPSLSNNTPNGTTWAHVAAIKSAPTTKSPPTGPKVALPGVANTVSSTPVATPRIKVAVPHIIFAPSPAHPCPTPRETSPDQSKYSTSAVVSSSPAFARSTQYKNNVGGNSKLNKLLDTMTQAASIRHNVAAWEPVDTTELIRQRHCQGCFFCQSRMRSADTNDA